MEKRESGKAGNEEERETGGGIRQNGQSLRSKVERRKSRGKGVDEKGEKPETASVRGSNLFGVESSRPGEGKLSAVAGEKRLRAEAKSRGDMQ